MTAWFDIKLRREKVFEAATGEAFSQSDINESYERYFAFYIEYKPSLNEKVSSSIMFPTK